MFGSKLYEMVRIKAIRNVRINVLRARRVERLCYSPNQSLLSFPRQCLPKICFVSNIIGIADPGSRCAIKQADGGKVHFAQGFEGTIHISLLVFSLPRDLKEPGSNLASSHFVVGIFLAQGFEGTRFEPRTFTVRCWIFLCSSASRVSEITRANKGTAVLH